MIMEQSLVVNGLVAKRSELAGEVEHHRQALQRLGEELGHLDATIRLFDPDYDLGFVRPRKRTRRTYWFGAGEYQRLLLETLPGAREPLSGHTLAQALRRTRDWRGVMNSWCE